MNRVLLYQHTDSQTCYDELLRVEALYLKTHKARLKSGLFLSTWSQSPVQHGVTLVYGDDAVSEAEWLVENVTPSVATAA